ncbi:LOW QUALITY PROTEIN: phosphoglycan beta 1,3 galactosyltransferase 7 [Leishmania infantum JPCM5]|uniref:Phosphoglycan beta 1,3 galactosyltransferase 7 n=1 Tax=Leishmania infantum TaxID=5671 RepID=A4IAQ2_LEIIN|nr:LOW QUALITY PROTEIN: phosphoglycan beta 1,3 galactosyltransferase 7 [Leishmania infantum JPCM5]CAM71910.2 phosphoglycan beta 1,3 galactosyltransferase 7 [Leishmania infantum JPCM5]|eukprot:XP_001468821.2 LOW QUALITY PROTEIN: phosphoglycan beta 1,3 galactosyltransferase 7 [Leishmania infantum JPCM5]
MRENNAPPAWAPRDTHRADPLQLLSSSQKHCGLSSAAESGQGCHSRSRGKPEVDSTRAASGDKSSASTLPRKDEWSNAVSQTLPSRIRGYPRRSAAQCLPSQIQKRFLVALAVLLALIVMVHWAISPNTTDSGTQQKPLIELPNEAARLSEFPSPFSVLVQHKSAWEQLTTTQRGLAAAGAGSLVRLDRDQLPSWTLRVIDEDCTMCFDNVTYASAVAANAGRSTDRTGNQRLKGLSVFATTSAPLGLMGPMLFAMASVTDDVDIATELPRWQWVTRSYAQQRRFVHASQSRGTGERPRHLIVMGIPSTDQPKRYPLRDAQRATWLTYREVARTENNFTGALLQLYVFAAAERDSEDTTHSTVDVAQLAPTVSEYAAATAQHLTVDDGDVNSAPTYVQRRVVLRDGWRDIPRSDDAVWKSPCAGVRTSVVTRASLVDGTSPLAALSAQLSLPVTPAFTAAAQYVCHVSAALWQEALHHRNSLWLDFLTDRKPTTKKKMGDAISWGIPTEVGMTQKVVIWLNYAYTAFPDVPYIMKGDDDTYLKVPQYLSDLRHVRGGWAKPRNLRRPFHTKGLSHRRWASTTQRNACIECGGTNSNVVYGHGPGYALDRRLIQAVLNTFDVFNDLLLMLLMLPYTFMYNSHYASLLMQHEDLFVGRQLQSLSVRVKEMCAKRPLRYVSDKEPRSLQVLRPAPSNQTWTWSSVLMHYAMPAIPYFIHYYFKHEFEVAEAAKGALKQGIDASAIDANATQKMKEWVASQVPTTLADLKRVQNVSWVRGDPRRAYVVAEGDGVAVYDIAYRPRNTTLVDCAIESGK